MSASDPVTGLLIAIPTVIVACRGGAALARRVGQPPVVGEIAAGILLGPSLLGWLWPTGQALLIPPESIPYAGALGQLALLVFMFLIGLELDLGVLRGLGRTALVVSQASIALPLLLGAALASGMYATMAPEAAGKLPFVLFIAVALSITAFPVLARILTDRGMYHTPLGALAMACAAVNDAMAWCLLAVVVTITRSGSALDPVVTVALSAFFLVAMLYVIRPALARWTPGTGRAGRHTPDAERDGLLLLTVFTGICLSSLATDRIGLHALFGAFVFGLVLPADRCRSSAPPPGCAPSSSRCCFRSSSHTPGCERTSACSATTWCPGCGRRRSPPLPCSANGAEAPWQPVPAGRAGATRSRSAC